MYEEEKNLLCVTYSVLFECRVIIEKKMPCESMVNRVFEYARKFCNIVNIIITCALVQSVEWETVIKESKV